jgi:hypothetical protein
MSEGKPALRVKDFSELDDTKLCYFKDAGIWYLYLPGCGLANLERHKIEEHEDGTISVTPSILLTGHESGKPVQKHGYFTRGVWKEA